MGANVCLQLDFPTISINEITNVDLHCPMCFSYEAVLVRAAHDERPVGPECGHAWRIRATAVAATPQASETSGGNRFG
jgi:hypothetical protein